MSKLKTETYKHQEGIGFTTAKKLIDQEKNELSIEYEEENMMIPDEKLKIAMDLNQDEPPEPQSPINREIN